MPDREVFVRGGWIRDEGPPLAARLAYPLSSPSPAVSDRNRGPRDRMLDEIAGGRAGAPRPVPCCLGGAEDVLVAEVERYEMPLRTVVDRGTGLMRSDPYYSDEYINHFYSESYRDIYTSHGPTSPGEFLSAQVASGDRVLRELGPGLGPGSRVLDVGCGMGGFLVPFVMAGHRAVGCDYGRSYLEQGRRLGLDLREGGAEAAAGEGPFDLVILSHVLEHQVDPVRFLMEIRPHVAQDGMVLVLVPGLRQVPIAYQGDLLSYLQNAHVWHFVSDTLRAVLGRAGFEVLECDESIKCLARPGEIRPGQTSHAGESVLRLIAEMESALQRRNSLRSGIKSKIRSTVRKLTR